MDPPRRLRPAETAAHRHARRQRQADRVCCQIAAAARRLARHHGSDPPRILGMWARRGLQHFAEAE
eukprot:11097661-Alexandrium_andersonii.AAC.1